MEFLFQGKKVVQLFSGRMIKEKVKELGRAIASHYKDVLKKNEAIVVVPVLDGAIFFAYDLVAELRKYFPPWTLELDTFAISSYRDGTTPGEIRVDKDLKRSARGRHLLLVEDIVDTGRTIDSIKEYFKGKGVRSLVVCALVNKTAHRMQEVKVDFVGFELKENLWVIGYGLDKGGKGRELPWIGYIEL